MLDASTFLIRETKIYASEITNNSKLYYIALE